MCSTVVLTSACNEAKQNQQVIQILACAKQSRPSDHILIETNLGGGPQL